MRSQYKERIIVSVAQGKDVDVDTDNFQLFRNALSNLSIPYDLLIGVYKGTKEASFMLDKNDLTVELVEQVAKQFNQESFLVIDNEGNGYLKFTNGNKFEHIGKLKVTDKKPKLDHSHVLSTGEYFYFV